MSAILEEQYKKALQRCQNLHSSIISRDFIELFSRVANETPEDIGPVIDILLNNITVDRSNTTASLYCLIKLADLSDPMKKIVSEKVSAEVIEYYTKDHNQDISNNAKFHFCELIVPEVELKSIFTCSILFHKKLVQLSFCLTCVEIDQ